jgi:hypothetical protein
MYNSLLESFPFEVGSQMVLANSKNQSMFYRSRWSLDVTFKGSEKLNADSTRCLGKTPPSIMHFIDSFFIPRDGSRSE